MKKNPRSKGDGLGKTGGRKKGTPNKVSGEMRELLTKFSKDTYPDFIKAFNEIVEPEKKCKIWLEMQPYVTPKLSSVELKTENEGKSFKDELDELEDS